MPEGSNIKEIKSGISKTIKLKNKLKFEVFVTLKKEVLDPQGKAVENALGDIGLNTIKIFAKENILR